MGRPTQLRAICRRHGLRTSGKRKHLVNRLLDIEKKSSTSTSSSTTASETAGCDLDPMWSNWDRDAITKTFFENNPNVQRSSLTTGSSDESDSNLEQGEVSIEGVMLK